MAVFHLVLLLMIWTQSYGSEAVEFRLHNKCGFKVWPGMLTSDGSAEGWKLKPHETMTISRDGNWSGRFWGRTGCKFNGSGDGRCATGDCNGLNCRGGGVPPVTLAEFTLGGYGGNDFYDVSLVDGFNIPMKIRPKGGRGSCRVTSCKSNVNAVCPNELKVWNGNSVVACKSACLAWGESQYCCTGAHNKPATCPPSTFSRIFKDTCPDAYSYAYDDLTSTFTCSSANYDITFCP
ncbi:pathogenesis-related protein 5-like [Thrips palmi]|uniref:Pathogenesis-related protein 5-like n=1 Tax=Thrips palmi TaxID=161013 RepID=A0A6P8ZA09_THRPL|nr:pathogenesis-related protein 5-like [Thrips palmi]